MAEKSRYRLTLRYFHTLHGVKQPMRIPKLVNTPSDVVLKPWFRDLTNAEQRALFMLERWCGLEGGHVPDSVRWIRKNIGCNERSIQSLIEKEIVLRIMPDVTATVVSDHAMPRSRLCRERSQMGTKRPRTGTPIANKSSTSKNRVGILNSAHARDPANGGSARRLGDVAEAFEWSTMKARIQQLVSDGKNETQTRMVLRMTMPESHVDECLARYAMETKHDTE